MPLPPEASQTDPAMTSTPATKSMDEIVALCRRRGFIFQSSEIYGGINGFWDYGPLGTLLKRNLKQAWWEDVVERELIGPDGHPVDIVSVDTTIIMHPKVWEASGHVGGFNDPMVDDKETKQRFRADHIVGVYVEGYQNRLSQMAVVSWNQARTFGLAATVIASNPDEAARAIVADPKSIFLSAPLHNIKNAELLDRTEWVFNEPTIRMVGKDGKSHIGVIKYTAAQELLLSEPQAVPSPLTGHQEVLMKPRQFNLMFDTYVGAVQDEESKSYLRPETAQGIFVNFWNIVDTSRVKVPFGIAQQGKAFRNEVTPRNFTFRSREFEQMEIEFFIHPSEAQQWYEYWCETRFKWWQSIGLTSGNLQKRAHDRDELAHYAKEGAGTSDIEYRFPFTAPGYGELEGVAHRADFDLKAHANATGKGDKLKYFDQELQVRMQNEGASKEDIQKASRYFPHVIEPSAGADRGTLAVLCEAFTPTPDRAGSKFVMNFHPRMAPIKAAVFPLVAKDGMPEIAEALYKTLRKRWNIDFDVKQSIGKRYARMDEAGTPFCITIDGETAGTQTVTVRHRDTAQQEHVNINQVVTFLEERIGGAPR
jgi:glycyl-tRNA synthetase